MLDGGEFLRVYCELVSCLFLEATRVQRKTEALTQKTKRDNPKKHTSTAKQQRMEADSRRLHRTKLQRFREFLFISRKGCQILSGQDSEVISGQLTVLLPVLDSNSSSSL